MGWLLYYAIGAAIFVLALAALAAFFGGPGPEPHELMVIAIAWPIVAVALLGTFVGAFLARLSESGHSPE